MLPAGADLLFGELNSAYPALANEADSGDPKAKAMAANSLLDRGFGKPAQILQVGSEKSLEVNVATSEVFTPRIASMADRVITGS